MLSELNECSIKEQKPKIEEMNALVKKMNVEEFKSIYKIDMLNKIDAMIEEKKLTWENAIILLKQIGYYKTLNDVYKARFDRSLLIERIKKKVIEEWKKNDEKEEKLVVDLCECFILLIRYIDNIPTEVDPTCLPCILKTASNKEESEKAQHEVEMALLALTKIYDSEEEELHINPIKEIIKQHQRKRYLTHLGYQSAWELISERAHWRQRNDKAILNELNFISEAVKELEELSMHVDWEKIEESGNKTKEECVIRKWVNMLYIYFFQYKLWNKEHGKAIDCLSKICKAARERNKSIIIGCIQTFEEMTRVPSVNVEALIRCGSVNFAIGEIQKFSFYDNVIRTCLEYIASIKCLLLESLKENREMKRTLIRETFEMFEEEGFEDMTMSIYYGTFIHYRKSYEREELQHLIFDTR
ncbi:uncharacterized protein MONOS_17952 [Monocercomonoides exilis]|uniref:uncharacterized protein n=1 Tax=Monocercomonoides exilis TaxID=2049356 RepID=UPI003559F5B9|nr:hypothetical protein MONOS_17952 [Monocercomonoides exilis]